MRKYKAIIADDQMPVLQYLQAKIAWHELGIELLSLCSDGEEAWEACRSIQPHILITDIGMPLMSGLELIEKARASNPELKAVILSCHEEFHYAQRAVKLNVKDYILKESMNEQQLHDILQRLVQELHQEQDMQAKHMKLQHMVSEGLSTLRTSYIRALVEHPLWDEEEWLQRAHNIGIDVQAGKQYELVTCLLDGYEELEVRFGGARQLQYVIENALQELISQYGYIVLALNEHTYYVLCGYTPSLKVNRWDVIVDQMKDVQAALRQHMKINTSYVISEPLYRLIDLKKQLHRLSDTQLQHFYGGVGSLQKFNVIQTSSLELFAHYSEAVDDCMRAIQGSEAVSIEHVVDKWRMHLAQQKYPIDRIRSWIMKIVTELEMKYSAMQHFLANSYVESVQKRIYSIHTLEELCSWLVQFLDLKMRGFHQHSDLSVRKEIAEAKRYITNHLHEKISMDEMARSLNFNSTHFSRVFKKETGETFVEYVTREKMEKAKELLDRTAESIERIAQQLGYDNSSYFNKCFRVYAGLSANEYRKRFN